MLKRASLLITIALLLLVTLLMLNLTKAWWQHAPSDTGIQQSKGIRSFASFEEDTPALPLRDSTPAGYEQRLSGIEKDISALKDILNEIVEKIDDRADTGVEVGTGRKTGTPAAASRITVEQRRQMYEDALTYAAEDSIAMSTTNEVEQLITASSKLNVAESHQVQCAGSMCKIEVLLPAGMDPFEKEFYTTEMLQGVAGILPSGIYEDSYNPDGSMSIVFYLAKSGYTLPTPENPFGAMLETDTEMQSSESRP